MRLPSSVHRKDGTRVIVHKQPSWTKEFKAVLDLALTRRIALLLPSFFIRLDWLHSPVIFNANGSNSYFYNGFLSTWLTTYFVSAPRSHLALSFMITNGFRLYDLERSLRSSQISLESSVLSLLVHCLTPKKSTSKPGGKLLLSVSFRSSNYPYWSLLLLSR